MASLLELTAGIVAAHAGLNKLTADDLLKEIELVHTSLKSLESGAVASEEAPAKPEITMRQAFKKDEVVCMICGKGGFKTLTRHLKNAHDIKPGAYRKQFGIASNQALTAKCYSESRKKFAEDHGLAGNLALAREARLAKAEAKEVAGKSVNANGPVPTKSVKTRGRAKTDKAPAMSAKTAKTSKAKTKSASAVPMPAAEQSLKPAASVMSDQEIY